MAAACLAATPSAALAQYQTTSSSSDGPITEIAIVLLVSVVLLAASAWAYRVPRGYYAGTDQVRKVPVIVGGLDLLVGLGGIFFSRELANTITTIQYTGDARYARGFIIGSI